MRLYIYEHSVYLAKFRVKNGIAENEMLDQVPLWESINLYGKKVMEAATG